MIGKQRIGAAPNAHDAVKSAGVTDPFPFTAKIRMNPAFLGESRR
jgi:hypothetical protein